MRLVILLILTGCALPEIRDCPCADGWYCRAADMQCTRNTVPVARFTCDQLMGTRMSDASGNGHDATCEAAGCPTLVTDPEREGMVCAFADLGVTDGQRMRVPHDEAFASDAFTVAVWVNPTGAHPGSVVGKPYSSARANSWQIFLFRDSEDMLLARFVSAFCPNADDDCSGEDDEVLTGLEGTPIPTGSWTHLAIVWDGATQYAYVDGELTESAAADIDFDDNDITIGMDANPNPMSSLPFPGMLDDVRIYDRALEGEEISALAGK